MVPPAALRAPFSPTTRTLFSPPRSSPLPSTTNSLSLPRRHELRPLRRRPSLNPRPRIADPSTPLTTADTVLIFQELGLGEGETEALLHKHPELGLAPPESLRRRILSLQSVGITGPALHHTISRRPEILTSAEIEPFLDFVRQELQGLRPAKLERLLAATAPRLLTGFSARIKVLLDHGVPHEKLSQILNNVDIRKVFCERPIKELEEMALFLERYGWPELILRRPMILNLDLHGQLIPRVEFLTALGGGDEAAAGVLIGKLPAILSYTVKHFQSHVEFWQSVRLTDEQVFKIALVYPNVFSVSRERKLRPRIAFLEQCGLGADDMFRFLIKAPLFLSLSFDENLSKKLALLVKLGYRHRTRELALAVGAATRTSCENMQAVIGLFFSYGLSSEDVLAMSKKHPQVLQYNQESLEKKMEFLVEGMERDVGELLVFPAFLGYKLDDRIKRRYEARMKTRGKGMSLNKLLSVATKRFLLPDEELDGNAV